MKPATAPAPPGGKKAAGPLIKDAGATAATNLGVLRRTDPDIEEVLGTAGHVCLYGFDVDAKLWVRAQCRGRNECAARCMAGTCAEKSVQAARALYAYAGTHTRAFAEPQGGGGLHLRGQAVRRRAAPRVPGALPQPRARR